MSPACPAASDNESQDDDNLSSDETVPLSPSKSIESSDSEGFSCDRDDCSSQRPDDCPRSLTLDYYERDDATLQKKWEHMDFVDRSYSSREERILCTTLRHDDTVLERNPFPYLTPAGVQHWTLWCVREMTATEIVDFVVSWIRENIPAATRWNYDENESRSIDLFHVHVYIEVPHRKRGRTDLDVDDDAYTSKRHKFESGDAPQPIVDDHSLTSTCASLVAETVQQ